MAGMAALPQRLARKIRAHPLGLRRNHPPPGPARAHRPDRQQPRLRKPSPQSSDESECPKRKRRLPSLAYKSSLDPRLRLHLRRSHHPRLSSRAKSSGPCVVPQNSSAAIKWRFNAWAKYPNYQHDEKIGSRMAKAADAAGNSRRSRQIPRRPRRRLHRRQRTRHPAHHRRMPAQQNAATQSAPCPARTTKNSSQIIWELEM